MLSMLGKFIWVCSIILAVVLVMAILGGAASEEKLFKAITFLAAIIWGGGTLLVGRFFLALLRSTAKTDSKRS